MSRWSGSAVVVALTLAGFASGAAAADRPADEDVDGSPAIRVTGQNWGGFGVLFHCQGEDGNHSGDFRNVWLSSVDYEIQEGSTGAVILVGGFKKDGSRMQPVITMRTKQNAIWDPEGDPRTFTGGFLFQSTYDTTWKDERGFRGKNDPDKPIGEWNRAEMVAKGGDITYFLDGQRILEATEGSYTEGRIMFQSEGAEIFFRRIELHPLTVP